MDPHHSGSRGDGRGELHGPPPTRRPLIVRRGALALCIAALAACGGGGGEDGGVTQPPPATVASVVVAPDTAFLAPGTTATLIATPRDAGGAALTGKTVTWTSANLSVATVTAAGVVTGVGGGVTTISASVDGKTGTATALVSTAQVNFTLDGLYATQAVQRFDGSVPLVVGGNAVLVNVFGTVTPLAPGTPRPRIRVRIMRGTQIVAEDTHDATGSIGLAVNRDVPIHQALFPNTVVQPGISVVAEVNPTGAIPEANRTDNVFPRSGALGLVVRTVPELRVNFIPVLLSSGGSIGNVTVANVPQYLTALRQMHPVGAVTTNVASPLSTDVAFGSGDQNAWVQILQAIDLRRVAEGSASHYFGVLRPPNGVNFVTFGGWGYIPTDPNGTGPGTRSAVAVQVGWFSDQRRATINVAHELAHNMGRRHAPCGGATGVDPAYPYANAVTGAYGHDVFSITGTDPTTAAYWNPTTATDLMSYCIGWISDYTYEGILTFRSTGVVASVAPVPARDVLVVSGRVHPSGVSLGPAFPAHVAPTASQPGPYTLEAIDVSGRVIASTSFASNTIDHAAAGTGDFVVALPISAAERGAIAELRVSSRFGRAAMHRAAAQASIIAPLRDLRPERIAADRVELRWDAARWPGIMVRDPETAEVIGIGTSGRLVVATERRALQVVLSDGIGGEERTIAVP